MNDVIQIDGYDVPLSGEAWAWAGDNAAAIKRFWARAHAEKPAMFNGDVLVLSDHAIGNGILTGCALTTDFASFLYWKDKGLPLDAGVRNVFGCAVVRSGDGHLLFGHMAPHTAGSGRVYPMAGTPDPSDASEGKLDLEGSIVRELKEESGLDAADATRSPGYLLVEDGGMCSLNAVFTFAPFRIAPTIGAYAATDEVWTSSDDGDGVAFAGAAWVLEKRSETFTGEILVQGRCDIAQVQEGRVDVHQFDESTS